MQDSSKIQTSTSLRPETLSPSPWHVQILLRFHSRPRQLHRSVLLPSHSLFFWQRLGSPRSSIPAMTASRAKWSAPWLYHFPPRTPSTCGCSHRRKLLHRCQVRQRRLVVYGAGMWHESPGRSSSPGASSRPWEVAMARPMDRCSVQRSALRRSWKWQAQEALWVNGGGNKVIFLGYNLLLYGVLPQLCQPANLVYIMNYVRRNEIYPRVY